MRDVAMLALWLASVLSMGFGVLAIIFRKDGGLYPGEKVAFAYPVGLGAMTVWMTALSAIGIRIETIYLVLPSALLGIAAFYFRQVTERSNEPKKDISGLEKFFIIAIALQVSYVLFKAFIIPIEAYDAVAIYGLKAKIFYLSGGVPQDFFTRLGSFVPHAEYPFLVPLSEASVYIFLGNLNDLASKVIFPLYYLALLAVLYYTVFRIAGRKTALLFTFLLATVPQISDYASNGYADLPLAFYFSAGIMSIIFWIRSGRFKYLILSFVLSIFAAWTKPEGLMLSGIGALIVFVHILTSGKSFMRHGIIYITAVIATVLAYIGIMRYLGLNPNSDFIAARIDIVSGIKRIPAILYQYQIQFFGPKKWNIAWILFILAFVTNLKAAFSENIKFITISILAALLSYTAIYMITPKDLGLHLSTTASRLFIHFFPLVILWLAITYKERKMDL